MIEPAKIIHTFLGTDSESGAFYPAISLEYSNQAIQSCGFYTGQYALIFIQQVLAVLRLSCWEQLKSKQVRVERQEGCYPLKAIGHATEDRWFYFETLAGGLQQEYKFFIGNTKLAAYGLCGQDNYLVSAKALLEAGFEKEVKNELPTKP